MLLIGITGGVGTGKSTVARLLGDRGAITFSADDAAREVVACGSPVLQAIIDRFGPEVLAADGSLDRPRMAERVFHDPGARKDLEAITHPAIGDLLHRQIAAARASHPPGTVIVVEVPLLYEAGLADEFDAILVVAASDDAAVARLVQRGLAEPEARARIAAQMPIAEKVARADFVVHNEGSQAELAAAIDALWSKWTKKTP